MNEYHIHRPKRSDNDLKGGEETLQARMCIYHKIPVDPPPHIGYVSPYAYSSHSTPPNAERSPLRRKPAPSTYRSLKMNECYDAQSAALGRTIDPVAAEEYMEDPDRLYGDRVVPQQQLKSEQPWHRLLLYFKARGLSNVACAEKLGISKVYIGQVSRQPWFRQKLVRIMREEGLPGVQDMLRAACPESILKLVELRDGAKSEVVQANCAMDLINRYLGKAAQPIVGGETPADVDERKLDAEIAELQKKVNPPAAAAENAAEHGTPIGSN
jgi:hypothetical protein